MAYFKTGDLKQAEDQLARARDLDGKDASTRFDLALVFLSQDDYVKAAVELEASNKLNPSNALGHILLGRAYLNSNRSLQAIDEFKTALKLDPSVRLGHYHLGFAYASLGRDEEAIAEYKEELRRSGESQAVVYELGRSLLERGQFDAAISSLQRASQLDASNPDVWYNFGKAQLAAGQGAPAEISLRKATELSRPILARTTSWLGPLKNSAGPRTPVKNANALPNSRERKGRQQVWPPGTRPVKMRSFSFKIAALARCAVRQRAFTAFRLNWTQPRSSRENKNTRGQAGRENSAGNTFSLHRRLSPGQLGEERMYCRRSFRGRLGPVCFLFARGVWLRRLSRGDEHACTGQRNKQSDCNRETQDSHLH